MFNRILRSAKRWVSNSSENALEEAYQRALAIKQIEDEHFQGQKISLEYCNYGDSVWSYFQGELNSNLNIIKLKINQFKTNKSIQSFLTSHGKKAQTKEKKSDDILNYEQEVFLEKLSFIDNIINNNKNLMEIAVLYFDFLNLFTTSCSVSDDLGSISCLMRSRVRKNERGKILVLSDTVSISTSRFFAEKSEACGVFCLGLLVNFLNSICDL